MLRFYNRMSHSTTARYFLHSVLELSRVATKMSVSPTKVLLQAASVEHCRAKDDIVKQLTPQVTNRRQRKCTQRDQPEF
jgi:hypothetical protein